MSSSDAEERLFSSVLIRGQQVDSTLVNRLRDSAIFEVLVEGLDRACLAWLAGEGFSSMRATLLARIAAINQPLAALYSAALIASDADATELNVRTLAGDTAVVLAYRFKCYTQRAARDLGDLLLLHYDEQNFQSQPVIKYWRVADIIFSPATVRIPFFRPPPGSSLPNLRTALSTSLPPPGLNLSLSSGSQGQFSGSTRATSSQQPSPAPFGRPSRLTEAANAAAASRDRPRTGVLINQLDDLLAFNSRLQAAEGAVTAANIATAVAAAGAAAARVAATAPQAVRARRQSGPPAALTPSAVARDSTYSPARAEVPSPAGVVSSSTPVSGPAAHPLALSRAEYHERYAATQATRERKGEPAPKPAQSRAQQPESAEAISKPTEEPRPSTPSLPEPTASQASVASASSSTIVAPAQRSPKARKSRPRKRGAEDASSPAEPAAKQAPPSGPVLPYLATRAATKSTAVAASTSSAKNAEPPATVSKPESSVSHTDLQQFARQPSSDSSESPERSLHIDEHDVQGDHTYSRAASTAVQPETSASAEPVTIVSEDSSASEQGLVSPVCEEGAFDEPEHDTSTYSTPLASAEYLHPPAAAASAVVSSVAELHTTSRSSSVVTCAALPAHVTCSISAASASPRARDDPSATAAPAAASSASFSRAAARSPSPDTAEAESWVPSSPIRPLVWAPAPAASSLESSPPVPRGASSLSVSRSLASPAALLTSPTAQPDRVPFEILPDRDAVVIVVEPVNFKVNLHGPLTMKLARRIVAVDRTGVIANWRVQCEAPTQLERTDPYNPVEPEAVRRLPLKSYTEAIRDLSRLLVRKYMVFYDRDTVLDALRLSLPLKRTTDLGRHVPLRNAALRVGGTCWCRTRNTLVDLEMLWTPNLGSQVPEDLVARATGLYQLHQLIASQLPHVMTNESITWIPGFEWFSRPGDAPMELTSSILVEERVNRYDERTHRPPPELFDRFNFAPQPASPFYFRIARQYGLDQPKLEAVNRLIHIVPFMGLALCVMLVNAGLIPADKQEEWRREHTRRHLSSETSVRVYELIVDAPSKEKKRMFYKQVNAFLSTDDNTLRARARSAEWPAID